MEPASFFEAAATAQDAAEAQAEPTGKRKHATTILAGVPKMLASSQELLVFDAPWGHQIGKPGTEIGFHEVLEQSCAKQIDSST